MDYARTIEHRFQLSHDEIKKLIAAHIQSEKGMEIPLSQISLNSSHNGSISAVAHLTRRDGEPA